LGAGWMLVMTKLSGSAGLAVADLPVGAGRYPLR
jgi:hypothetical protein